MFLLFFLFFLFKQKTAYELRLSLVGSEMSISDSLPAIPITSTGGALTISFTSTGAIQAAGFVASVSTSAAVPAVPASSLKLVGAVPAQQISGLACAGRIRTLYDALPTQLDSAGRAFSFCCAKAVR